MNEIDNGLMNEKWMLLECVEIKHQKPKSLPISLNQENYFQFITNLIHNQILKPENSKEDTCGGLRLVRDQLEGYFARI